jgi:hypothetical protein
MKGRMALGLPGVERLGYEKKKKPLNRPKRQRIQSYRPARCTPSRMFAHGFAASRFTSTTRNANLPKAA